MMDLRIKMDIDSLNKIIKEKVNPILGQHFGACEATEIKDGVVFIKMTGACGQCPSAQDTIEMVVKEIIMNEVEDVKDVVLDDSVSEGLLKMAREILERRKKL